MKIEVLQENLVKGIGWAVRFVANKPSLPILSKVKLKANKEGLEIVASSMDTGITVQVRGRVVEAGEVCVPAKLLYEYLQLVPVGKMVLEQTPKGLLVQAGNYKAVLAVEAVEEFPDFPKLEKPVEFGVKLKDWEKVVELVGFCASSDVVRPVLTGILLQLKRKSCEAVATDGYRLSKLSGVEVEYEGEKMKLLLPAGVVSEVARLAGEVGCEQIEVKCGTKRQSVLFRLGEVEVITRMIEGEYPDFGKIMPKESSIVVKMETKGLEEAVRAASVFARDNAHIVRWQVSGSELVVRAQASLVGEQEVKVEVVPVEKGEGEIAFNGRFLLELLSHFKEKEVIFGMNDSLTPGTFTGADKGFVHVIMPVRV